ncbi:MAG: PadR family transcriptional regulator [Solirubrobacteraceae bacterium]
MAATAARLIVLATVLDQEPVTGYAVRKTLLDRGIEAWGGMSVASIYSVLGTLTRHGLLEELPDPSGVRSNTRAYRTTEQGSRAFQTLWAQAARTIEPAQPLAFHVAITLTALVPRLEYIAALRDRLDQPEERLSAPSPDLPLQVLYPLSLWRSLAEAEVDWLRQTIELAQVPGNPLGFAGN